MEENKTLMPPKEQALETERDAKAEELESTFSYDGYQVVRKELFAHLRDPAIVIRKDSITFNTACISGLEDVVYVHAVSYTHLDVYKRHVKQSFMEMLYAIKRDHEENGENAWLDSEFRMIYQKVQEHVAEREMCIRDRNTSERGWVRYFNEIIQPDRFVNL